ncbi:MAG: hypothetical protein K2M82_05885 [Lachnospiraceae bacterium]|nr:hypothetical protein [Lachnospiraceae bacterium]
MNERRKRILKESLFLFPFLIVVSIVSIGIMFAQGRTIRDTVDLVEEYFTSDSGMDLSVYAENNSNKYTLKYYYGEKDSSEQYAEYTQKTRDGETTCNLVLYEPRDGYQAGYYTTEWFYSVEYVTYAPLDDENSANSYPAEEEPYMYEYIRSYSYDSLLTTNGVETDAYKGYKLLGFISLYSWDYIDRTACAWGIGSKPFEFYIYYNDSTTEYKKVTVH